MKKRKPSALIADDSGATIIEYGLIAGFGAVAAVAGLLASGETLAGNFNGVAGELDPLLQHE